LRGAKALAERHRLNEMFRMERSLWRRGFRQIAGVDEAGVGPLAGPVVAAAVILPRRFRPCGLNDSKKIGDPSRRADLARRIREEAIAWGIGQAEVAEIDMYNVYQASLLAMERAVAALAVRPDFVLADARTLPRCPVEQRSVVRGDALSASIAAASILAKTTRDSLMEELDRQYPGYGFAVHKGYPTPEHRRILQERGAVPAHRRTFLPVRQAMGWAPVQRELFPVDNEEGR
jgi:ribonuclease HII